MAQQFKLQTVNLDEAIEAAGKMAGVLIFGASMLLLRGWLLSVCAGWLLPGLALTFPQWILVAWTFRLLIIRSVYINKP